jgi:PKD repeat protein
MPANHPLPGLPSTVLLLLLVASIPALASADNHVGGQMLTTIKSGTVSGGLYVDDILPGGYVNVRNKTFAAIPDVSNIQWARLYVSAYSGHMQEARNLQVTTYLDGNNDGNWDDTWTETASTVFTYVIDGGNDNTAQGGGASDPYLIVNAHMNRVTSDYLIWYDVTSKIASTTPTVRVDTSASYDGRIKMITLVVAYNDGDSDEVRYWVNQGHDVDSYYTDNDGDPYVGATSFSLSGISGTVDSATLKVNHMASSDGTYTWNGNSITNSSPQQWQAGYSGGNTWDVTSTVQPGNSNTLTYDRTGPFYKIPLATLEVRMQGAPPVQKPVADFEADKTSGPAPLTVQFTDRSTNNPTSWAWDFQKDDTVDSTLQNPAYTYTSAGTYTVNLTASNAAGNDTRTKAGLITVQEAVPAAPSADFAANITSGSVPLAVLFSDSSTGDITSWLWDFGDGNSSPQQNPVHTYTSSGTYTINLTVSGPGGENTASRPGLITVTADSVPPPTTSPTLAPVPPPVASFTASPLSGRAPLAVQFSDTSSGTVDSRSWDLGDGSITGVLTATKVNHTYTKPGTYTVTLTVTWGGGTSSITREGLITVYEEKVQDLAVASIIPNGGAVFTGSENTVKVGVKNPGQNVTDPATLSLTVSDGYTARKDIPAISAGETFWAIFTDPTVRQTTGTAVTYTGIVDPDGIIQESNEANNNKNITKTSTYNGYRGKRWGPGGDLLTRRSFDLNGSLVYSAGDSRYQSGTTDEGWATYTVTWSSDNLPIPENATVEAARLYIPYTWDNTKEIPDRFHVTLNGQPVVPQLHEKDQSYFGAYADHAYGLLVYDVTSPFRKQGNQAVVRKDNPGSKVSPYGMTLAVVFRDISLPRAQIFMVEGFDLLGADPDGFATTPEEATAYLSFTGPTVDTAKAARAILTTFVPSGNGPEGNLLFNDRTVATSVWDYGASSGTQVAVDTRDVGNRLRSSGNEAAVRSTLNGATPIMAACHAFLVVTYPLGGSSDLVPIYPTATLTPTPTPAQVNETANATVTELPTPTPSPLGEEIPSADVSGQAESSQTAELTGESPGSLPDGSAGAPSPQGGAGRGASPLSALPSPLSPEGAILYTGIPSSGAVAWFVVRSFRSISLP